jgi:hypothetical protein
MTRYIIEFETGDSLTTEDKALADLHREKGRLVMEIDSDHLPSGITASSPIVDARALSQ